jgi:hypothetical protein
VSPCTSMSAGCQPLSLSPDSARGFPSNRRLLPAPARRPRERMTRLHDATASLAAADPLRAKRGGGGIRRRLLPIAARLLGYRPSIMDIRHFCVRAHSASNRSSAPQPPLQLGPCRLRRQDGPRHRCSSANAIRSSSPARGRARPRTPRTRALLPRGYGCNPSKSAACPPVPPCTPSIL